MGKGKSVPLCSFSSLELSYAEAGLQCWEGVAQH